MLKNLRPQFIILLALPLAIFKVTLSLPLEKYKKAFEDDSIDLTIFSETIFGEPDVKTGDVIAKYKFDEDTESNPEELGSYFEGDILIPTDSQLQKSGIIGKTYRWPDGIIPYRIDGDFTKKELKVIYNAFNEYHNKTCIRFEKRTTERNYISITNKKTGCWSSVGRIGGRQRVNFQTPECLAKNGTSIHELMHVVGFFHEHNRSNRDKYIKILKKNIEPSMMDAFKKLSPRRIYGFGLPYDYASVMHYSNKAFSRNDKKTILTLEKTKESSMMGQRIKLSDNDIIKINTMYKCEMDELLTETS